MVICFFCFVRFQLFAMARGTLAACLIAAACSAARSRPSRRSAVIHDIRAARPCTITLRGGADDGRRVLSGFDQQLQDEILHDIKRSEQGKPPLFVEQLGDEEPHGAFKYGVGVEAAMPPAIMAKRPIRSTRPPGTRRLRASASVPVAASLFASRFTGTSLR